MSEDRRRPRFLLRETMTESMMGIPVHQPLLRSPASSPVQRWSPAATSPVQRQDSNDEACMFI